MNIPLPTELTVSPKMVLEIASGIREPAIIAQDYGYSEMEWEMLKAYDPFIKAVDAKKAELKASGYTFRMKAALAAEDLLESVYIGATEEGASVHTKLEALKFLARAAGLDAPVKEQMDTGPAFSISINLGNGQSINIGATATKSVSEQIVDIEDAVEIEEFDFTSVFAPTYPQTTLPKEQE